MKGSGMMRYERKLLALTRREGNLGQAVWQSQWFLLLVVVLMSLTDFSTLFSILDQLTVTSRYLGTLITASAALLLNLTPVLAAEALLRERCERWKAMVPGLGFVLLFGLQAFLRWQTRDMLVSESSGVITFQMEDAGSSIAPAEELSTSDTAMCIFLMLLPLCTSLVCFGLALLGKTPEERAAADRMVLQQKRRSLASRLEAEIAMLDASERQMDVLKQAESQHRKNALALLEAEKKMAEAISMEELALSIHSDGQQLDEITLTGQYPLHEGEVG